MWFVTTAKPLQNNSRLKIVNTPCLKKVNPFYFLWLLGQMLTDFNNIWYIAAEKICKQMTYSLLIISS